MASARPRRRGRRAQSREEEWANGITHGAALIVALVAMPFLVLEASQRGDFAFMVGAVVFAVATVLLYCASTIYHALPYGDRKKLFRLLDYAAVFVMIAGTYTPFCLGALRGPWGWSLLTVIWGLAVDGITLSVANRGRLNTTSLALYLSMGWLVVVAIRPFWTNVPLPGLLWLLAGGVAYTTGVTFLVATGLRYAHAIWHGFVCVGTSCHFIAVLYYAAR